LPITVGSQVHIFIYSIAGGMLIAFIYDIFRIKRKAVRTGRMAIYVEDLLYWVIIAFVMLAVVYYSNEGEIRGFVLVGAVFGVILYTILLSRLIVKLSVFILRIIYNLLRKLFLIATCPFRVVFRILSNPLGSLFRRSFWTLKKIFTILRIWTDKMALKRRIAKNIRKKI